MMYTFGLDYASHQGWIDFAQLRAEGNEFAITKVTGEGSYINPYWERNHAAARAAGLIVGTYDWVEPQGDLSGDEAARDYLRVVGDRQPGDLLTVDFETPEWYTGPLGRDIEAWMRTYLYTLKELSGQPVIVYTAPYFLQETGAVGWDWLGRDFLYWMAAPGEGMAPDDAPWQQPLGPPWSVVTLHQHQWYARSSAIGTGANFDRNRFNGDRAALMAYGKPGATGMIPVATDEGSIVQEPPSGKFTAYINDKKETIFCWNAGGEAERIDGIAVVDLGVSVVNAAGEKYDRSIQDNVIQVWHDRKQG